MRVVLAGNRSGTGISLDLEFVRIKEEILGEFGVNQQIEEEALTK